MPVFLSATPPQPLCHPAARRGLLGARSTGPPVATEPGPGYHAHEHRIDEPITTMTPPKLTGLLEFGLYADDLAAMERFYGQVLGLEKIAADHPRHVFFRVSSRSMLLIFNPAETSKDTDLPPHGATGVQHFAFSVAPSGFDAWKDHLRAAGVTIEREINWPNGARSVYFLDPADHCVEIVTEEIWGA